MKIVVFMWTLVEILVRVRNKVLIVGRPLKIVVLRGIVRTMTVVVVMRAVVCLTVCTVEAASR